MDFPTKQILIIFDETLIFVKDPNYDLQRSKFLLSIHD